ncbi:plasmid pRiA4b ORF-3 family protein [Spirosoma utsteinense]|uniref:Plasmid pRiA4b Orf3-like domain-containing protein n=1 Tax=Spirosoma utsteinense TaxID=2585773 RepID=A0ABR6WF57_9BACT|nr:plasmid pRiA4b ORF-3 family protein [Spirosoma utsteinense]MBC3789245.1 hypothetical protein [Spirosoma utsteinense]MBC3795185.1 hypothetical protein [Spirosoma utsteinense]
MDNIIQLKITLRGTKPAIWRRVLVEKTITFEGLHEIIQIVMGWANSHLHEFTVQGIRIGQPLDEFDADFGEELIDEATVTLESVLTDSNQKVDYTYDFGDSWDHTLMVEKWLASDSAITYPICTGGKLNCPPEDCGGIPGFYEMLHIVNDERHPEHQEMLEWLGEVHDDKAFDQQEVNRQLVTFFHSK